MMINCASPVGTTLNSIIVLGMSFIWIIDDCSVCCSRDSRERPSRALSGTKAGGVYRRTDWLWIRSIETIAEWRNGRVRNKISCAMKPVIDAGHQLCEESPGYLLFSNCRCIRGRALRSLLQMLFPYSKWPRIKWHKGSIVPVLTLD